MADNSTAAALAAGVGTSNNVQFVSVTAGALVASGGYAPSLTVTGGTICQINASRTTSSGQDQFICGTGAVVDWVFGELGVGDFNFSIQNAAGHALFLLNQSIGCVTMGGPCSYAAHLIENNANADNTVIIRNDSAGGYSAIAFQGQNAIEHMAIGYGNDSSLAITRSRDYLEISSVNSTSSTAPLFAIIQTTDYGSNGTISGNQYARIILDQDGTFRILKRVNTDVSFPASSNILYIDPDTGTMHVGSNTAGIDLNPATGIAPPNVNTATTSAATVGAGRIVWDSVKGAFFGSNGTSWVHL